MGDDGARYAQAAIDRADCARKASAGLAHRAIRRHLLLNGGLVAASVLVIGLVDLWLPDTWLRALLAAAVVAALVLLVVTLDRAAPARATPPRRTTLVVLAVAGPAVMATAAVLDHYVTRYVAVTAAAVVGFVVFAIAGWRVGR